MTSPLLQDSASTAPVLFVAREPDETLRTFMPVIERLQRCHGRASRVLFHHEPGSWTRSELERLGVGWRHVRLPERGLPTLLADRLGTVEPGRTLDEIGRFWQTRALAREILARERPAAVVVIQDTLLLERFLVREANRRGVPTLVVQWAFNFPQAMYDRLRRIQYGTSDTNGAHSSPVGVRRLTAPITRAMYRAALGGLGLRFELANSYGGGEARLFAVMGEAFREQYLAQGVRGKRVVVTGHPTHDLAYARATTLDDRERAAIRVWYGLPTEGPIVLYATQPVLWRRVLTPDQLRDNVRAIAAAVAAAPGAPRLVLKLHPREQTEQYGFCDNLKPPVRVIAEADMTDLIAACDAFVSSSSSTALLAMMLDRPIVTVNFNAVPHFDAFESMGATLHTRSPAEFERAIRLALADEPTRERLESERRAVLTRYTRFDGRATERLAGLIVEAIASGVDDRPPTAEDGWFSVGRRRSPIVRRPSP